MIWAMKGCDHILSTCYSKAWGGDPSNLSPEWNTETESCLPVLFSFLLFFFRDVVDLNKKASLHQASDVQLSVESSSALRVEPSRAQQHEAASQLRWATLCPLTPLTLRAELNSWHKVGAVMKSSDHRRIKQGRFQWVILQECTVTFSVFGVNAPFWKSHLPRHPFWLDPAYYEAQMRSKQSKCPTFKWQPSYLQECGVMWGVRHKTDDYVRHDHRQGVSSTRLFH